MSDKKISRRTTTHTILQGDDFDEERRLMALVEEAAARAGQQRLGEDAAVVSAAEKYDAFVTEAAERGVAIDLMAMRGKEFRALLQQHPARKGNAEDLNAGFNIDTIAQPLIVGCVVDGQFDSAEELEEFLDDLADGQFNALFTDAHALNRRTGPDPKDRLAPRVTRTRTATPPQPERLG